MSAVAAGLFEILLVDLLDDGVFMRFSEIHLLVGVVKNARSDGAEIDVRTNRERLSRLTASVDAAARARHDLNELNVVGTVLDAVEKFSRVAGTGSDSHVEFKIAEFIGSELDAIGTSDFVEVEFFKRLTENDFRRSSESRFHNASGSAEDDARAGTDIDRSVEFLVCKVLEINTRSVDHSAELTGRDRDVDAGDAVSVLIVTGDLKLLRGARDGGYEDDILRVDTQLFSKVGLIGEQDVMSGSFPPF